LDGGVTTSPASHFAISSALSDPTDPASTKGIFFTIGDDATPVANLTVTVTSSNTTIVPNANLSLTTPAGGDASSRPPTITTAAVGRCQITVTVNDGTQSTDYVIEYGASQAGPTGSVWPTGIADASAAIPVDDNYMVIGDDESNLLYLYNRSVSGLPVKTF